jgi:hypothetical protein
VHIGGIVACNAWGFQSFCVDCTVITIFIAAKDAALVATLSFRGLEKNLGGLEFIVMLLA